MKNRPLLIVLLLSSLLQLGCVSVDQRMQAYVGQHYSTVVATWGAPDSEIENGEGGKLLTWDFSTTQTTPATVTTTTTHQTNRSTHTQANLHDAPHSMPHCQVNTPCGHSPCYGHANTSGNQVTTTTYIPESTTTNTYTRSFYTDAEGVIYHFAWQGWHPGY